MAQLSVELHGTAASRDGAAAVLLRALGAVLPALLVVVALVVAWRRMAGALQNPLDPPTLVLTGLLLIAMSALALIACAGSRRELSLKIVISLAVVAVAAGVTLPGAHGAALSVFWAAVLGHECWVWSPTLRQAWRKARRSSDWERPTIVSQPIESNADSRLADGAASARAALPRSAAPAAVGVDESAFETQSGDLDEALEEPCEEMPLDGPATDVLQQLTLSRASDGSQRLAGWLRMPVTVGQRTGNLHVAFCPPFPKTPEIEFEQISGPLCRVRLAQRLPYGARLELKLSTEAVEADSVLVRFSAEAKGQ